MKVVREPRAQGDDEQQVEHAVQHRDLAGLVRHDRVGAEPRRTAGGRAGRCPADLVAAFGRRCALGGL